MIQQGLGTVSTHHRVRCTSDSTTEQEKRGHLSRTASLSGWKTPENVGTTLLHKVVQHPLRELEGNDVSLLFLATFSQQELTGGAEVSLVFSSDTSSDRVSVTLPRLLRQLEDHSVL